MPCNRAADSSRVRLVVETPSIVRIRSPDCNPAASAGDPGIGVTITISWVAGSEIICKPTPVNSPAVVTCRLLY